MKESPANIKSNVKFVLATDGESFEAENVDSGETIVCEYSHFSNYFVFFLNTHELYIDRGNIPVNGITNPTWTIMTLANRLAKYLAKIKDLQ